MAPQSHAARAAVAPRRARNSSTASNHESISPLTVNRLSVYLRCLHQLREEGIERISSQNLAARFHLSSTQIRKDLAQFGEFGIRGIGYEVAGLSEHLSHLLGVDRAHRIVIVGMGNIGTALARSPVFNNGPFLVVGGFDIDPAKLGRRVGSITVEAPDRLARSVRERNARLGVIAVPAEAAAAAFQELRSAGVTGVLNFAPVTLPSAKGCRVKNVDLRIHLEELAFFLGSRS